MPRSLPPFRFPLGPPAQFGKGVRLSSSVPCLSSSCLLPAPREGADVGLKEVKSTSAASLWSLVIQKANWGESTGKKREEEKPQETFCTIPRNREAFRQATAIPLKPETWRCTGPPSGAGETELVPACWVWVSQLPPFPGSRARSPNLWSQGPPGG